MRKFKLLALVLAIAMLSCCFASCSGGSDKITTKVTVSVIADDEVIFGPVPVELEHAADAQPTILVCVEEAFILNDVAYDKDDMAFKSINGLADTEDDEYTYWWDYTINGAAPSSGRAGTILAQDGDVIVYTYTKVLTSELIAAEEAKD